MTNISIVAGPCAVESKTQLMNTAYKLSLMRDIAKPYGVDFKLRGGAWKPRTTYKVENNGNSERVFEGIGESALKWLGEAGDKYDLPIVSELMSEQDMRYFHRHLNPERDYIQIGARTSQAFALLFAAGVTNFGVILKNPQHGIDIKEALGAIERFENNREVVYCTRGQKRPISPHNDESKAYRQFVGRLNHSPNQHPDSRNLNNMAWHSILREQLDPKVKLCHDPSHTWGGKTEEMKRTIGEYAIKAIQQGYDWVMLEVNDKSRGLKCDGDQAMLTTTKGVDWSKTCFGEKPKKEPITLIDVVIGAMEHQIDNGASKDDFDEDKRRLKKLRWDLEQPTK
ncbi:hypothetical protein ACFLZ7_01290 [Nanoarchaeota archaeon]